MALVSTSPMFVDAPLTSPQRDPSGILETVIAALPEHRLFFVAECPTLLALEFGDGVIGFALPLVAEPLVEHERQDVVLVILPSSLATQDVGGAPEVRFELLERELHGVMSSWADNALG